ncbi:MAG: hypothetical protein D4S02_01305 [Rhodocyclaceae bacterium]|nr:MAG: hypothetical protein D4S02_01305 [Rhodocyclaceae bacterium]
MNRSFAMFALALVCSSSAAAASLPSSGNDENSFASTGIPRVQFCHRAGTDFFHCDEVQLLPAALANTSIDSFDDVLVASGCLKVDVRQFVRRFHCGRDAFQWGAESVWWRSQRDGRFSTSYIYVYD